MIHVAVNKAYKMLDDPEQLEYCKGVWEEAKATVDSKVCVCVCVCVCVTCLSEIIYS